MVQTKAQENDQETAPHLQKNARQPDTGEHPTVQTAQTETQKDNQTTETTAPDRTAPGSAEEPEETSTGPPIALPFGRSGPRVTIYIDL